VCNYRSAKAGGTPAPKARHDFALERHSVSAGSRGNWRLTIRRCRNDLVQEMSLAVLDTTKAINEFLLELATNRAKDY